VIDLGYNNNKYQLFLVEKTIEIRNNEIVMLKEQSFTGRRQVIWETRARRRIRRKKRKKKSRELAVL